MRVPLDSCQLSARGGLQRACHERAHVTGAKCALPSEVPLDSREFYARSGHHSTSLAPLASRVVEAPGVALVQQRFRNQREVALFRSKLLIRGTFDVFIDSSGFLSIAPESTEFVEALWRRRESVPGARETI